MPASPYGTYNWIEELENLPQAAYYAQQPQWGAPKQQRYYQGQFQEIQNQYLGRLGQQMMGGGMPSLQFTDFLGNFPWTQQYAQLPPSLRGDNPSLFNPRTQYRYW